MFAQSPVHQDVTTTGRKRLLITPDAPPPLKKHLRSSLERRFRCFDFEWDRAIECCEISRRACWGGAVARWRPCRGMDTRGLGTRPVRPLRYTRRPAETDDLWLSKWTRDRRTAEQPTRLNSSANSNVVDRSSPFSRTPTASRLDDTVFLAHCSLSSAPHFLAMNLQVTAAGWQRRLRGVGVFFAAVAAHTCRGLWKRHPRAAPSRPISSAYRRCLNRPLTFCCLPVCCRLLDLEDLKGNGPAAAAGAGRPPRRRSPVTGESKRVSCCIILVLIYWLTVLLEWVPSGGNAVPAGWLGLFVLVNNNMVTLNTCLPDARWNLQRQAFFHLFRPAFKTVFN